MINIAIDVDNTLIFKNELGEDELNVEFVMFIGRFLEQVKYCKVYVWSGGGVEYAQRRVDEWNYHLENLWHTDIKVIPKHTKGIDICFDDQEVILGKVNCQIKDAKEMNSASSKS